jgi:hypothetical protein
MSSVGDILEERIQMLEDDVAALRFQLDRKKNEREIILQQLQHVIAAFVETVRSMP